MMLEKGVALLSGGIDSPVAIHLMKNKVTIIAVHFHQLPLTDQSQVEKVKELAKKLGIEKLYLVPFAETFKTIVDKCDHRNYFILSKIVMFKCAELVAHKEGAKYLITGENLAQVSSQTLSNLKVITQNVGLEILRPVLAYDKQEIIDIAKSINTYETSKGPEICDLLGPTNPATKSDPEKIKMELERLDYEQLLKSSLDKAEVINNETL
jgi:tRNA uracil 4-sulfurtransferase